MSDISTPDTPSERLIRDIRRATRKQYSAEEKIRIVLDGLRGDATIAELCRCEGIAESLYYSWSKEFLEAGKRRLAGDTSRAATSNEVKDLRRQSQENSAAVPSSVHTSVYKDLIQRVVAARTAARLSQQAVADRRGKPQSYIAKVEALERRLDIVEFLDLANAIGFDPMSAIRAAWKVVKAEDNK